MAGMTPAFMNQPQYQQQMQGLAMQVRQQEEGTKKIKKFLKAYEDIQLSAPMAPQQPGFMGGNQMSNQEQGMMQPPGGAMRSMNNNLPQNDMTEPAPTSFSEMAGGSAPVQPAGEEEQMAPDDMTSEYGAGEEMSTPTSSDGGEYGPPREQRFESEMRPSQPSGSPGDPGLSKRGSPVVPGGYIQAERKASNEAKKQNAQNAAFDKTVKDNSWTGMPSWIAELKDWVFKAKREVKIAENTGASKVEMKVLKRTVKNIETDLKNAKKIDKSIADKLKKIASSTPNKAMGLAGLGAGLLAGTGQAGATAFPPEDAEVFFGRMNADKDFNRLNAREKAAVQKYLEYKAESDSIDARVDVPKGRAGRMDEPIEYSSAEKALRSQ
jgi:hypothetical protein